MFTHPSSHNSSLSQIAVSDSSYQLKGNGNQLPSASSLLAWFTTFACLLVLSFAIFQWISKRKPPSRDITTPNTTLESLQIYRRSYWRPSIIMIAKTTFLFLLFVILFSIIFSYVLKRITTDTDANNVFVLNRTLVEQDRSVTLDDRFENLFWFIQISDTHFNVYNDRNRASDLKHFCHNLIPIVNPPVLVLTGDITDSRSPDPMGSDQYIEEWRTYNETRFKCMHDNPNITWLDIRGNHDNFNVYKPKYQNYYQEYTVQGNLSKDGRSYRHEVKAHDGHRYSFIGVDACIFPGIRRPFNFIGRLDSEEIERIKHLKQESENSTYQVWFGHYPTSSIANADDLRPLIKGPYLCGHYHNFHGIAPLMYSTQPQGYLEAELGDWKANRKFRIGVIDGGLFTFSDFQYRPHRNDEHPLIVISNPRSNLYQMETFEPFWRSARSSHIRALVFSRKQITHVSACITNNPKMTHTCLESFELKHIKGPLWVAPWSTQKYREGLYYITVFATNDDHHTSELTSPFSFSGEKPPFTLAGRISLRIPFQAIGFSFFLSALCLSIAPMFFMRILTHNDNAYFRHMNNLGRRSYFRKLIFKLYLVAHIDKLFFPLISVPIYLCLGPWIVGRFVGNDIGVVFVWGTLIDGYLLPVSFTFIFGALFLIIFYIPFVTSIAIQANYRCSKAMFEVQLSKGDVEEIDTLKVATPFCNLEYMNILFLVSIIILEFFAATLFYFAYGIMAMFLNAFAGFTIFYVMIFLFALRLNKDDFKEWL